MKLLYKTPIAAFLLLWMGSWAVAAGAESAPPDREMLRMMDLLRDMEMIKQIDMLQEMPNLEQRNTTAKSASAQKPLPAKPKESAK